MCMRQELSAAQSTSASVSRTLRTLSEHIAADTAGFFSENVPPKPQHSSAPPSGTSVRPRTCDNRSSGREPTFSERREWQVGW